MGYTTLLSEWMGLFLESEVIENFTTIAEKRCGNRNDGRRIYCSVMTMDSEAAVMLFML